MSAPPREPFSRKPRSAAGWTIFIFGALALALGLAGLVSPPLLLRAMGISPSHPPLFVRMSAMAATNMGVYYVLAALSETRRFFAWTVPFRGLTFSVFTAMVIFGEAPPAIFGVAVWELAGAVATAIGLRLDARRARG